MSITIFLADDHTIVRDGLRFLLEAQSDFRVVGDAADGREAIRQITQLHPNVVILDIAMPELNGLEAARQIRELCPATQVIILSMYATTAHIFQAIQAGVKGYLLKAAAGVEVVNAVRSVQAGRRYLTQKILDRVIDECMGQRDAGESYNPLALLSSREREVLQLVVEGKSSVEIAEILSLSPKTIETYRSTLMRKLGISDLPSLVKFAIQYGITSLE
ncbi:MAG: response regulator transcription factor [Anaerolineae bacterium]